VTSHCKSSDVPRTSLPCCTQLDKQFIHVLGATVSSQEVLRDLYGPVYLTTDPIEVYTDGSSLANGTRAAAAGAGIYFGPHALQNAGLRVPGKQTNNRAELFAILSAVVVVPLKKSLVIYTDSQYAIRSILDWAPMHSICGWSCENGDVLRHIAAWLRAREAPLKLNFIHAHAGNRHGDAADLLAKAGARAPLHTARQLAMPDADQPSYLQPPLSLQKVTSTLPPLETCESVCSQGLKADSFAHLSHRGRAYFHAAKAEALQNLVDAASNPAWFWKTYRKLADPK
jgi:ribonuclease HI